MKSLGANTLLYPAPVLIVGTYDKEGRTNMMTVAWGGISCSSPPCVAISLREATYTYGNILDKKAFTISIPSKEFTKEADYIGMASGKKTDKFAVTGLTPVRSEVVDAPYVKEFPLILECKLAHRVELGLHTQFIGEILDVKAEESILDGDGHPDLEKLQPIIYVPGSGEYWAVGGKIGQAYSLGKEIGS